MLIEEYLRDFPSLANCSCRITSPQDIRYNCVAWAIGDPHRFWWPGKAGLGGYYWPDGLPNSESIETFIELFRSHGFEKCADGLYELEYEKIALYADSSGSLRHVARQISDHWWASKMGAEDDIEHGSLEGLEGMTYSKVQVVMKKLVPTDGSYKPLRGPWATKRNF